MEKEKILVRIKKLVEDIENGSVKDEFICDILRAIADEEDYLP